MSGRVKGKTVIVTGGSKGFGEAIAETLCREGASVLITARNAGEVGATGERLKAKGYDVGWAVQDVSKEDDWSRVMQAFLGAKGRLDVLVNNAGISILEPIAKMSLETFRKINTINLHGSFLGLKYGVEAMRRHAEGGSIIMMSSILGKVGLPNTAGYAASKGGVKLMAKAAALELGPERIRVNSVHPAIFQTPMVDSQFGTSDQVRKAMAQAMPLKRLGQPQELANAVLFLASDESAFMTGAELVIDGGMTAQ